MPLFAAKNVATGESIHQENKFKAFHSLP